MVADEAVQGLIDWMESLDVIPGTVEYEARKKSADQRARSLGYRSDDPDFTYLREVALRVFPDAVLDEAYSFHDARALQEARRHQQPVLDLLPDGFFTDYQTLTSGSLSPAQYDFLVSLNALGAWMARNVRINIAERYFIYPPCSVLLVSMNPGLGKSQALKISKRVLSLAGYGWVAPDRVSASMFLGIMHVNSQADLMAPSEMLIMASELAGFFRESDQATSGMIMDLADLMDMPTKFTYATRKHGMEEIRNPTLSMAGCSNMDWLVQHMPKECFTGGWLPRQYVSVQTREDAPRLDRDLPPPSGALRKVIDQMKDLEKFTGSVRMSPKCVALFVEMRKRVLKAISVENDERKAAYLDRRPTNALRLAMLFALSQKRLLIEPEDMDNADKMLSLLEETHYHLYNNIGLTQYGRWKQITYEIIRRTRDLGLPRPALKAHLAPQGMKMTDLDQILEDLLDSKLIETGEPRIEEGHPVAYIRAVDPDREINEVPTRKLRTMKVVKNDQESLTAGTRGPILATQRKGSQDVTGLGAEVTHADSKQDGASEG